jgi:hypothetical protein
MAWLARARGGSPVACIKLCFGCFDQGPGQRAATLSSGAFAPAGGQIPWSRVCATGAGSKGSLRDRRASAACLHSGPYGSGVPGRRSACPRAISSSSCVRGLDAFGERAAGRLRAAEKDPMLASSAGPAMPRGSSAAAPGSELQLRQLSRGSRRRPRRPAAERHRNRAIVSPGVERDRVARRIWRDCGIPRGAVAGALPAPRHRLRPCPRVQDREPGQPRRAPSLGALARVPVARSRVRFQSSTEPQVLVQMMRARVSS